MQMALHKTKWFLPLFSLALGVTMLAAFWIGDNPTDGLAALGVMAGLAAVLLVGGRSETVRGLRGDGRDERFARIDLAATAVAGNALIGVVIALCLWEWAHGRDGTPYTALGAVAGLSYLLAIVGLRLRG